MEKMEIDKYILDGAIKSQKLALELGLEVQLSSVERKTLWMFNNLRM